MADNLPYNFSDLSDFLRQFPTSLSSATCSAYTKAVRSFLTFAGEDAANIFGETDRILGDWFVDMIATGISIKTASYYLDNLCSILGAAIEKTLFPDYSFRSLKEKVRVFKATESFIPVSDSDFSRLLTMVRTSDKQNGEIAIYTDIAILSLIYPDISLEDTLYLKKKDLDTLPPECREFAERHVSSRKSYIFPLGQSATTPSQIRHKAEKKILSLLRYRGIPISGNVSDSLTNLWIGTALRCGYRASTIASVFNRNHPLLQIVSGTDTNGYEQKDIFGNIRTVLVENPKRWHVMRLRQGVKFSTLKNRFDIFRETLPTPDTFYPCEEIAHKIGRKMVYKDKPLIPGIVFIKTRSTDIAPIMHHVGDIAWCMRDRSRRDCPYAVISRNAMETFQQVIGQFTSDSKLYPLGTVELKPDDRVIIIGGDYSGTEAIVEKSPKDTTGDIIYQIRFIDDTGFEWHIPKDQRLLRKL